MDWFHHLTQHLNLHINSEMRHQVSPQNYWLANLHDLKDALRHVLQPNPTTRIAVVVDGVNKESGVPKVTIDQTMRSLLSEIGADLQWINLSQVLGVAATNVHASSSNLEGLQETFQSPFTHIVALGSGSITDLCKHALHTLSSPAELIVIPTALTVTAYTSAFAVLESNGVKRTQSSRLPHTTLWVEPFLRHAPAPMNRAGYGDLLAGALASADWALAGHLEFDPSFSPIPYRLVEPYLSALREDAVQFGSSTISPFTLACASAGLAMAGIATNVARSTAPISGFEHALSHCLDLHNLVQESPLALHGAQIALAGTVATRHWTHLLKQTILPEPSPCLTLATERALFLDLWTQLLQNATHTPPKGTQEALWSDYESKWNSWQTVTDRWAEFQDTWLIFREKLRTLLMTHDEWLRLCTEAGLPTKPKMLQPAVTTEVFAWAQLFARFQRKRLGVGDLTTWLGMNL